MRTEAEKEMWGLQVIKFEGKYIPYYRYLIQNKLGRKLLSSEAVHHINGNHFDNKIENLVVMGRGKHSAYHNHRAMLERELETEMWLYELHYKEVKK